MDIELLTDKDVCVYDVYRVTTCRPGREHIVAASRLLLVKRSMYTHDSLSLAVLNSLFC